MGQFLVWNAMKLVEVLKYSIHGRRLRLWNGETSCLRSPRTGFFKGFSCRSAAKKEDNRDFIEALLDHESLEVTGFDIPGSLSFLAMVSFGTANYYSLLQERCICASAGKIVPILFSDSVAIANCRKIQTLSTLSLTLLRNELNTSVDLLDEMRRCKKVYMRDAKRWD